MRQSFEAAPEMPPVQSDLAANSPDRVITTEEVNQPLHRLDATQSEKNKEKRREVTVVPLGGSRS